MLDFDYTELEAKEEKELRESDEIIKDIMEFKSMPHVDERQNKQRAYSYYYPNRDFESKLEDVKLKRIDDGTFVDNGYR